MKQEKDLNEDQLKKWLVNYKFKNWAVAPHRFALGVHCGGNLKWRNIIVEDVM